MSIEALPPAPSEASVAALRNVTKQYAGRLAVNDVSLEVPRGELVIITGRSGSGKSTLLRMLEGIEKPDAGEVSLFGSMLSGLKPKQIKRLIHDRVGVGFQSPLLDRSFSVKDNVRLTPNANHRNVSNQRVVELAVRLGLQDKLFQEAGTLSGGEQLRVSLMRTMVTAPELVLLDEPTSAIDTHGKDEAFAWIRHAAKQEAATVVMVTHDGDVARRYADREFVIESGQLIASEVYDA